MSWHIRKAGKGIDVAAEIGRAAEVAEKNCGHNEVALEAVKRSTKTLTELATMFPDKTVIAQSSGHVDATSATLDVKFEIVW